MATRDEIVSGFDKELSSEEPVSELRKVRNNLREELFRQADQLKKEKRVYLSLANQFARAKHFTTHPDVPVDSEWILNKLNSEFSEKARKATQEFHEFVQMHAEEFQLLDVLNFVIEKLSR